jgi:hypothetical protein
MSTTINELATYILSRRQQLDRVMRSDLLRLQCTYGSRLLSEAIKQADAMAARDKVSVSAVRSRRHEQPQERKTAQQFFRARERT